jgi:uncharacterized protein (TIGR02466 family)
MKNFLKFIYFKFFFRLNAQISKFIPNFKKKNSASFNKFFKKNKYLNNNLVTFLKRPKIFIFNHDFDSKNIINNIYNYEDLFKINEFTYSGNKEIYQSEHNLNEKFFFKEISEKIEKFINYNITKPLNIKKINLIKMWFVITKKSGIISKHSHFNSHLSGVLYLKIDNENPDSGLKIFTPFEEIDVYRYNINSGKIEKSIFRGDHYLFVPKNNDLVVFDSYLEHSVENEGSKTNDRISLPFDLVF